jgi:hypothetical protein
MSWTLKKLCLCNSQQIPNPLSLILLNVLPYIETVAVTRYLGFWERCRCTSRYCRRLGAVAWWVVTKTSLEWWTLKMKAVWSLENSYLFIIGRGVTSQKARINVSVHRRQSGLSKFLYLFTSGQGITFRKTQVGVTLVLQWYNLKSRIDVEVIKMWPRRYFGSYRRSENRNTSITTVRLCVRPLLCTTMITIFWNPMRILNVTLHERQATRSNISFAHRMCNAVFCKYLWQEFWQIRKFC